MSMLSLLGKRSSPFSSQYPRSKYPRTSKFKGFQKRGLYYSTIRYRSNRNSLERKAVDVQLAPQQVGTGWAYLLNGCAEGTDIVNRVGRRSTLKSLLIRGSFNINSSGLPSAPVAQSLRMVVVLDKQANGGVPPNGTSANPSVGTTVLKDTIGNSNAWAPVNLDYRDRLLIIADEQVTVSPQGPEEVNFHIFRKMNHEVTFNSGNAGTYGDISTGSLWLVFYPEQTSGGNAAGYVNFNSRVRFLDA